LFQTRLKRVFDKKKSETSRLIAADAEKTSCWT